MYCLLLLVWILYIHLGYALGFRLLVYTIWMLGSGTCSCSFLWFLVFSIWRQRCLHEHSFRVKIVHVCWFSYLFLIYNYYRNHIIMVIHGPNSLFSIGARGSQEPARWAIEFLDSFSSGPGRSPCCDLAMVKLLSWLRLGLPKKVVKFV